MLYPLDPDTAPAYLRQWGNNETTAWDVSLSRNVSEWLSYRSYETLRGALLDIGSMSTPIGRIVVHELNGNRSLDRGEVMALMDALAREFKGNTDPQNDQEAYLKRR